MKPTPSAPSRGFHLIIKAILLPAVVFALTNQSSHAGNATWDLNPTSGYWLTATNWTPDTVPNGPSDIATFDVSNTTSISISRDIVLNGLVFDPSVSSIQSRIVSKLSDSLHSQHGPHEIVNGQPASVTR